MIDSKQVIPYSTATQGMNIPTGANGEILPVTSVTATTAKLADGDFLLESDVDLFYRQGAVGVVATTGGNILFAGKDRIIRVADNAGGTDAYIAAITSGAAGNLYIKLIEAAP